MNNDVVIEILLHLPVRSLLRCKAVCKIWRDVIHSPSFRKLHSSNNNNSNEDDTVYLQFTFLHTFTVINKNIDWKLSIKLRCLDNGKSLKSHDLPSFGKRVKVTGPTGPVKGLICIIEDFIGVCNPFLGEFKILPSSSSSQSCRWAGYLEVGIGFDGDCYKVVEVLSCRRHRRVHAQLYSSRTDSWSVLGGEEVLNQEIIIDRPIKSLCKNGSFVHWVAHGRSGQIIILSFDMKNEVFRTIRLSMQLCLSLCFSNRFEIFAKDECSFLLFVLGNVMVEVYESRGEGSELKWNRVMKVELRFCGIVKPTWRRDDFEVFKNCDCVVLKDFLGANEADFYDCRAREFIGRFELPKGSEIIEYEGSLISP